MKADVVRVLDVDPELATELGPAAIREAERRLVARVESVHPGRRTGSWGAEGMRGGIGLLVVGGLLLRQVTIGRSRCAELLGHPDLLRPWDEDGGMSMPAGARVEWEVLAPTRVAVLDASFVRRAVAWPELVSALTARGVQRAQVLAVNQAIANFNRVEERVFHLLVHLAGRWGRVKAEGVVLELPLTHELLARLTGARRPSVTTALGQLAEQGLVDRLPDRRWLLPHAAVADGLSVRAGAA